MEDTLGGSPTVGHLSRNITGCCKIYCYKLGLIGGRVGTPGLDPSLVHERHGCESACMVNVNNHRRTYRSMLLRLRLLLGGM